MRRGFDGLELLVQKTLRHDPITGVYSVAGAVGLIKAARHALGPGPSDVAVYVLNMG
jgi:FlaA1/EpsC-like NDP-sugar epimerase